MIKDKTVFILGAGASAPYGYPTGSELKDWIITNFENEFHDLFTSGKLETQVYPYSINSANKFITQFIRSKANTIDEFLTQNPSLRLYGKLAIIMAMFFSEHNNGDILDRHPAVEGDWYTLLFSKLTNSPQFRDPFGYHISTNQVSFITFNYDRSFEHILFEIFNSRYGEVGYEEKISEFSKFKIIHVFGQIAPAPWEKKSYEYGIDPDKLDLAYLAENILVTDDEKTHKTHKEAMQLIGTAKKIVFLGFGFAPENIKALKLSEIIRPDQQIHGTVLGLDGIYVPERLGLRPNLDQYINLKSHYCDIFLNTYENEIFN